MTPRDDGLPLVLIADDPGVELVERARRGLDGVARLAVLPAAAEARDVVLREGRVLLVFAWGLGKGEEAALTGVRFVQSVWAGVDRIPVRALARHIPDVLVAGGTGRNAPQVAEHAVGLYLDCAKRITGRDRRMRRGAFPQETPGRRVEGSRVAVVGYGAIGRRVALVLDALGAEVMAVTRSGEAHDGRPALTLEACRHALGSFDGVVLALPLTRHTASVVDAAWLEAMRPDAVLVNVARGRLIDEDALYAHLVEHPEFQAGLDVWWHYPKADRVFRQEHPFEALDNVVMTPHAAFHVPGTRDEMVDAAVANVRRFLAGQTPDRLVDTDESVR